MMLISEKWENNNLGWLYLPQCAAQYDDKKPFPQKMLAGPLWLRPLHILQTSIYTFHSCLYLKNSITFFRVVNILETVFMNEKIAENGIKENMVWCHTDMNKIVIKW